MTEEQDKHIVETARSMYCSLLHLLAPGPCTYRIYLKQDDVAFKRGPDGQVRVVIRSNDKKFLSMVNIYTDTLTSDAQYNYNDQGLINLWNETQKALQSHFERGRTV